MNSRTQALSLINSIIEDKSTMIYWDGIASCMLHGDCDGLSDQERAEWVMNECKYRKNHLAIPINEHTAHLWSPSNLGGSIERMCESETKRITEIVRE